MRKVIVIDQKSGRESAMPERQANAVVTLGRGRYITRDMIAATAADVPEENVKRKPGRPAKAKKDEE